VKATARRGSLGAAAASILARAVEPAARRLMVLIYHRVLATPDPLAPREMTAEIFRWQMQLVQRHASVLPLHEALRRLAAGTLPRRAVCVTFDDGYADNERVALPILREFDIPATVFVTTGFVDGGRMWNDTLIEAIRRLPAGTHHLGPLGAQTVEVDGPASRAALVRTTIDQVKHLEPAERLARTRWLEEYCGAELPADLMMTSEQLRRLYAAGIELGAHTVSHPILLKLTASAATEELRASRARLAAIIGAPVRYFAYPNGRPGVDYDAAHVELARSCGFEAAFSTRRGACSAHSDRWQLPRFTPWDRTPARWIARLVLELRNPQ
jgi:peptidoglycan/xylan/chitin deacetylase (PgdA/CDA1 family)